MMMRNLSWLLLSALVIGLDQWSKYAISHWLMYTEVRHVLAWGDVAGFNLVLAHNTGAAFSFLAYSGGWQRWLFAGIAVVMSLLLLGWMLRLRPGQTVLATGIALLLGGALGNLYDRVVLGYVIDFLDVWYREHHWPAFNIADSAICAGAVLLLWDAFLVPSSTSAAKTESAA